MLRKDKLKLGRWRKLHRLEQLRPDTPQQLHHFVKVVLGLCVPICPIVEGNNAPFDYLRHTFFEGHQHGHGDVIVWASRTGGKTLLGAVATLLDMLFKPGIQARILGGSLEQSSRMYQYFKELAERPMLGGIQLHPPTQRQMRWINGSLASVMTQSHRSVRGAHVHKLRCDEMELFNPDIWQAAQMITQSDKCGHVMVQGSVEALSTMHETYGMMSRLVHPQLAERQVRVLRWCALDVVERCEPSRSCQGCVLWKDCLGRVRKADGTCALTI